MRSCTRFTLGEIAGGRSGRVEECCRAHGRFRCPGQFNRKHHGNGVAVWSGMPYSAMLPVGGIRPPDPGARRWADSARPIRSGRPGLVIWFTRNSLENDNAAVVAVTGG